VLRVRGHFTQTNGTNSGTRPIFTSTGTKVILDGSGIQNVNFLDPGADFSRFHDLDVNNTSGVTFNSDMYFTGQLTLSANAVLNQSDDFDLFITSRMPIVAAGTYNVFFTRLIGEITMTADLVMAQNNNNLFVQPFHKLVIDGHSLSVGSDLHVTITNTVGDGLIMTNAADEVVVNGDVVFTHGTDHDQATSLGNYTDGVIRARGDFIQTHGANSNPRDYRYAVRS
jgi:hypothetical protein